MKKLTARAVIVARAARRRGRRDECQRTAGSCTTFASYRLDNLDSLGGTSSIGASINDRGWVAGRSTLPGGSAATRRSGATGSSLISARSAGPDKPSTVLWPVKNLRGIVSGLADTNEPDPNGERWSCGFFFLLRPPGTRCFGFRWEDGVMTPLLPFGGTHGFATGTNDFGFTVGWAENGVLDATRAPPQRVPVPRRRLGTRDRSASSSTARRDTPRRRHGDQRPRPGHRHLRHLRPGGGRLQRGARRHCGSRAGRHVSLGDFGGVAWNTPTRSTCAATSWASPTRRGRSAATATFVPVPLGERRHPPASACPPRRRDEPGSRHSTSGAMSWATRRRRRRLPRRRVGERRPSNLNALVDLDQEDRADDREGRRRLRADHGPGLRPDEAGTFFAFVATPTFH